MYWLFVVVVIVYPVYLDSNTGFSGILGMCLYNESSETSPNNPTPIHNIPILVLNMLKQTIIQILHL